MAPSTGSLSGSAWTRLGVIVALGSAQADDDADLAAIPERHDRAHARPRALRVRVVDFVCKGAKERERKRDGDEHDE